MSSEKKCPGCGHWVTWSKSENDRCPNCQTELYTLQKEEKLRAEKFRSTRFGLLEIDPADQSLKAFAGRSINFMYGIFMAIVSFILWIISIIAP
jgi:hypothetical protein